MIMRAILRYDVWGAIILSLMAILLHGSTSCVLLVMQRPGSLYRRMLFGTDRFSFICTTFSVCLVACLSCLVYELQG